MDPHLRPRGNPAPENLRVLPGAGGTGAALPAGRPGGGNPRGKAAGFRGGAPAHGGAPALPAFLREEESTGARRGTLLHKAFSLTDLEALRALPPEAWRDALQEQKAAWVSRQLFTPQEAALLRPEDLLRFYTGPLGRRLLASPLVKREWSFNFRLSHEKETLLQGVMDCAFREGDGWVLLDYKTDRVEDPAAFVARYAPQLRLYAQALGEITALPVREMWLYAVGNGQAYPVPPGDAPETDPGRFAGI